MASTDSRADGARGTIERPFLWAAFALVMLAIPVSGFLLDSSMAWEQIHPAINALLNTSSAVFLVIGFRAIKGGNRELHKKCMLAAFAASVIFLGSYLARFYISGAHKYPGDGWDRTLYLVVLMTHMFGAMIALPLVLRTLFLGLKQRFDSHRRIARWTWPLWVYISVTGLLVYLMLYPIANRVYGP